jgi:D-glycerate 3-kinase
MWDAALVAALAGAIADTRGRGRPVLIGLSGLQGSGKSTLCAALETALQAAGLKCATLSLDDLYLTRAERLHLAGTRHPLFATRGVPGTHDLAMADRIIARLLAEAGPVAIPRFDKASDDRAPQSRWPVVQAPLDVLLFEGWCIAATPQPKSALAAPVNALEAAEDPDGRWRTHVNDRLAGDYAALFARLDMLVMLRAPDFGVVGGWRRQQEDSLRQRGGGGMGQAALDRFISHYERLSRHMLATAPPTGAIVIDLDGKRRITGVSGLGAGAAG